MVDAPYKQKYEGLDLPDGSWMPTNRRVNVSPVARDGSGLDYADEAFLRMRTKDLLENQHLVQGFFDPEFNLVAYPDASTAPSALNALGIRRHEVMHAYNAAARQGGEGLPFWSRVVANTPRPIARPLDELIAQRAGGRAFQDIPWDYYANRYAEENQLGASRIARGMDATTRAAQLAAANPVTVGVAAGGLGFMGYGLAQEDPEEADREAAIAFLRENGQLPDPTAARPIR